MKRAFLTLVAGIAVAAFAGCSSHHGGLFGPRGGTCQSAPETCAPCGKSGCGHCDERAAYRGAAPGPLTGAVAYPYYTTRGPRDFLARDPGSIGP
jgi:hypothetical protein